MKFILFYNISFTRQFYLTIQDMSDTSPIFEVPIIPPDLRQEETLVQIADCLDYLSKATDTVFNCINLRISENRKKLSELNKRAINAQMKVEKLKGVKKATQIFSTSKYPAMDIHKDYISIFIDVSKVNFSPSCVRMSEKHKIPKEGLPIEEKLQFFHVKGSRTIDKSFNLNEGLGKLPSSIESVSSLLLFNTSESPYERCVTLDPMGVVNKLRRIVNEESSNQMEAAPISIAKQEQLEEQVKENYFYSPSLGDVPNIDAPLDLPDLPGIADDLRYSLDLGPGFAPSVTTTPAIPDLPTIPEDSFKNLPLEKTEVTLLQPPPPPPPPPPSLPVPEIVHSPPPPPPLPHEEAQISVKKETGPAMIHATSDNARANLMAAIRNAGGKAKLKPIQGGRDESRRIKDEKNLASSGGDLMADLHNKLLLRRKGISGRKEGPPGVTAMDKVSAMIPAPASHEASSATEDDEWEE